MEVEILKQCLLKIKKALSCLYILFSPNSNRTPDFYSPPTHKFDKDFYVPWTGKGQNIASGFV